MSQPVIYASGVYDATDFVRPIALSEGVLEERVDAIIVRHASSVDGFTCWLFGIAFGGNKLLAVESVTAHKHRVIFDEDATTILAIYIGRRATTTYTRSLRL